MSNNALNGTELFDNAPLPVRLISRAIMGDDPAHGWPHILRVFRYSRIIANMVEERMDWLTLETAILLHDVGRFLKGEEHHAAKSAEFARELLPQIGYRGDVEAVVHAILAHSFSLGVKAETLEAMILSDADKLDALGAIGIARVFHTGCQFGRSFEESLEHFVEKIIKLPDLMYLDVSRKLAEEKVKIVKNYINELREELAIHG
ncbi:MAG: HD domain-containing protein [Desulfurococcales archaeon]|nr:HD domain-containing protein [Desulfurococcales archaeon]MCE4622455.1 HD domain-containing protein [Desulfurococcales archaeon]